MQIIQGPDKGRRFELLEGENIIGRQSRSVQLSDGTVSRSHARLIQKDGRWMLEDCGSANATYLNGVKINKPAVLKRGDQIRCGSTLLVFGGGTEAARANVDVDEEGNLIDVAIVATIPSNEDSVIIPTPEAGVEAIGSLRILYDLIADLSSIFNIDLLLQRTLDKVFESIKADRGFVMLIDESGKLTMKASRVAAGVPEQQIPISRTIINEVCVKQVGVLSTNAMSDKRFTRGKSVHDFGIRSAVCVPIKGRQGILGVIHVDCGIREHTYSTEQLRLMTAIGFQTGLALENVRLHEATVQSERLAAVGETVAYLSHHIKNILHALGAGIEIVEGGLDQKDLAKATSAWPIVQRNLQRINELILNMLAFSKSREPLLEKVDVNQIIKDCVELVSPQADDRNVAVLFEPDYQPEIAADSAGLHQAFLNLVHNALDAVADKKGVVTITSEYDSMNRNVVVRVADNGSGIPANRMDKLFTPFYSTKGQKGTGLGLAVTQKVIREHHGQIEVASRENEGTTFTVTLPALHMETNEQPAQK